MQREYWSGPGGERWAASQAQMDAVLEPFGVALLQRAAPRAGQLVVDVGCGCGATTLMAATSAVGVRAIGVDLSPQMLEVARKRAAALGVDASFRLGDANREHFDSGTVDRVLSRFGIMFFDDPAATFRRFRSWLKPDGWFTAVVWGPLPNNPWAVSLTEIAIRHVELPSAPPGSPGPFSLADPDELQVTLGLAGFDDVTQQTLRIPMRVEGSVDDVVAFYRDRGPIMSALERVTGDSERRGLLADLQSFVETHYDGRAMVMPTESRLVHAR